MFQLGLIVVIFGSLTKDTLVVSLTQTGEDFRRNVYTLANFVIVERI